MKKPATKQMNETHEKCVYSVCMRWRESERDDERDRVRESEISEEKKKQRNIFRSIP